MLRLVFAALLVTALPVSAFAQCSFADLSGKWMMGFAGMFYCPIKITAGGTVNTQGNCVNESIAPTNVTMTVQGNCSITFDFGYVIGSTPFQFNGVGWVSIDRSRVDGYATTPGQNAVNSLQLTRRNGLQ